MTEGGTVNLLPHSIPDGNSESELQEWVPTTRTSAQISDYWLQEMCMDVLIETTLRDEELMMGMAPRRYNHTIPFVVHWLWQVAHLECNVECSALDCPIFRKLISQVTYHVS
jgi:hypothetical protein